MPLYEYECKTCHHRFERIVKYSDAPMTICPDCGGEVEQTITAPAVQFKGSGFYITDYSKSGGSSSANGESGSKSKGSESSSSESKSETKNESSSKADSAPSKEAAPAKSETSSKAPSEK